MRKSILGKTGFDFAGISEKKREALEPFLFLCIFGFVFSLLAIPMGLSNMLNTLMNTAYRLLIDTTLYILAIVVVTGAISALMTEFGVVFLLNRLLSPLMRPLYGMPGAASLCIVTTYLSDNPAVSTLANDLQYRKYFKAYQIPAIVNLGTSFGMGLIVTAFMLSLVKQAGPNTVLAVLCGNFGAVAGSVVSTRLMLRFMAKTIGTDLSISSLNEGGVEQPEKARTSRGFVRIMEALLDGGEKGVSLGLGIIPGVLVICTFVMMLSNGPSQAGTYTGAAYEGIGLLPKAAGKLAFLLRPLFGFSSAEALTVPLTALGSTGAALGIIPRLIQTNQAGCNDIAAFTAMCMCWSGYLSTHVSMMDMLKCGKYTGKVILYQTIGGIIAGVSAHWFYILLTNI